MLPGRSGADGLLASQALPGGRHGAGADARPRARCLARPVGVAAARGGTAGSRRADGRTAVHRPRPHRARRPPDRRRGRASRGHRRGRAGAGVRALLRSRARHRGPAGVRNILGLVYLCGFQLDIGESLLGAVGGTAPNWWDVHRLENYVDPLRPEEVFYADVAPQTARGAIARLRHQSLSAFGQQLTRAAWRTIPSTYILCEQDVAIPIDAQERWPSARGGCCGCPPRTRRSCPGPRSSPASCGPSWRHAGPRRGRPLTERISPGWRVAGPPCRAAPLPPRRRRAPARRAARRPARGSRR